LSKARISKQAHAYTPGLKVKRALLVTKERRLPVPGKVLVEKGQRVEHKQIIAEAFARGDPYVAKVAISLGIESEDIIDHMIKKEGDHVEKDEPIAQYIAFFGLIKRYAISPTSGIIESISENTGQVVVRGDPLPIKLDAYIPGEVVKVNPMEGVIIQTKAAFIQGILGICGESHGRIKVLVDSPYEELTVEKISLDDKGCVLVGGSLVTLEALRKAVDIGVSGIVVGGIKHSALREFLGRDIGVAITGQEELGVTLIITEGFGKMTMSDRIFNLLRRFDGYMAHINGATQIRAGVMRPEILIPNDEPYEEKSTDELSAGMKSGVSVRIIRRPYLGAIGRVISLPVDLQQLESESSVRVVEVEINGRRVIIPRANVELIED